MKRMKLQDMKTNCRMCGKELKGDDMDDDFVTFYCMKCGIYTTKPREDFKDPPAPAPEPVAAPAPVQEKKA